MKVPLSKFDRLNINAMRLAPLLVLELHCPHVGTCRECLALVIKMYIIAKRPLFEKKESLYFYCGDVKVVWQMTEGCCIGLKILPR